MHGENHAKTVVLNQADALQSQLSNGHKADPETHGAALLLLLQMTRPMFEARFMTEEGCNDKMSKCPGATPPTQSVSVHKPAMSGKAVAGISGTTVGSVMAICITVLRLCGKL
jgi:hypothetical protein